MLRIYPITLQVLAGLRGTVASVQRRDADLARRMKRAMTSVALNLAEGMYSAGGNRRLRYYSALGSARETLACIEVAKALGYVGKVDGGVLAGLERILGTLVKLVGANERR